MEKSKLLGIDKTPVYTLGSSEVKFSILNNFFEQTFQIVTEDFPIDFDGILGLDFIDKYKLKLDHSNSKISLFINDKEKYFDLNSLNKTLVKSSFSVLKINKEIILPPRSENIVPIETSLNTDFLCRNSQPLNGIFVGNSICKATNNTIYISLINSQNESVSLNQLDLEIEPLKNYNVLNISACGNDRLKILKNNLSFESLNSDETNHIFRLCREYNDIFYLPGDKLSFTDAVEHTIPLINNAPIVNVKPYRLPIHQRNEIKKQINKLIDDKIVTPSKSPFNSPLLIVPKKPDPNGERRWRVVVDFRQLNDLTCGDSFPLPNITDILDQLGQSKYFTTLDLASGYHQVALSDEDRQKTAFSTIDGHFEFLRMPFGLKTAPATFQRMMNTVLTGINGIKCFVYLDDIVVYGKSLDDHIERLTAVFDRFRSFNLKLNPIKCVFLSKDVVYLGHRITPSGIFPDEEKIKAILEFPIPKDVKNIRTFLGLCGYYRRFIAQFALIAKPLNDLLKKNTKFE